MKHTRTRQGVNTNKVAKKEENTLMSAMYDVLGTLRKEYPNVTFEHKKSISLKDWGQENHCIVPDGGIIYATIDGKNRSVISSEMKYQKSKGSIFGRVWANASYIEGFLIKEGTKNFPYAVFCDGAEYGENTDANERNTACLNAMKYRTNGFVPSFFMREKEWTREEMYDKLLSIAKNTLVELL